MPKVDVNGVTIDYRLTGSGEPLVMIPGLASDHTVWAYQVAEFRRSFRCLVFEHPGLRGQGDEEVDVPSTAAMMAEDTAALMEELDIEYAHILGTSLGGAVAMQLAIQHPEMVRSLSLNATWPRTERQLREVLKLLVETALATEDHRLSVELVTRHLLLLSFSPTFLRDRWEEYESLLQRSLGRSQPLGSLIQQFVGCLTHDSFDQLSLIEAPTLVSVGEQDILTPPHVAEEIAALVPDSRLEILPRAGHAAFLEQPDRFNRIHLQFWNSLED